MCRELPTTWAWDQPCLENTHSERRTTCSESHRQKIRTGASAFHPAAFPGVDPRSQRATQAGISCITQSLQGGPCSGQHCGDTGEHHMLGDSGDGAPALQGQGLVTSRGSQTGVLQRAAGTQTREAAGKGSLKLLPEFALVGRQKTQL